MSKTPNVVQATNQDGLIEQLDDLQKSLTLCEKALAEYLETKRLAFPRFYFVSSADLLDVLSNGNEPEMVTKWVGKDFSRPEKNKKGFSRKLMNFYMTFMVGNWDFFVCLCCWITVRRYSSAYQLLISASKFSTLIFYFFSLPNNWHSLYSNRVLFKFIHFITKLVFNFFFCFKGILRNCLIRWPNCGSGKKRVRERLRREWLLKMGSMWNFFMNATALVRWVRWFFSISIFPDFFFDNQNLCPILFWYSEFFFL